MLLGSKRSEGRRRAGDDGLEFLEGGEDYRYTSSCVPMSRKNHAPGIEGEYDAVIARKTRGEIIGQHPVERRGCGTRTPGTEGLDHVTGEPQAHEKCCDEQVMGEHRSQHRALTGVLSAYPTRQS